MDPRADDKDEAAAVARSREAPATCRHDAVNDNSDLGNLNGEQVSSNSYSRESAQSGPCGCSHTPSFSYISNSDIMKNQPTLAEDSATTSEDRSSHVLKNQPTLADDSSSAIVDKKWSEDEWPSSHVLPVPVWGSKKPELVFEDVTNYMKFLEPVTEHLQDCISALPYNALSVFVEFCVKYQQQRRHRSLSAFYRAYDLQVRADQTMCVALCADLIRRLSALDRPYPQFRHSVYQASSEVEIEDIGSYCKEPSPQAGTCAKDHALVCVRLRIAGRQGVMLLDPGYHISLPITVMEDGRFPQSPAHVSKNAGTIKVNTYQFNKSNTSYVMWHVVKENKGVVLCEYDNVIYTPKPFLSGMDMAVRRILVNPQKIIVSRGRNGDVKSGLYFTIKPPLDQVHVTFFCNDDDEEQVRMKIPFTYFTETSHLEAGKRSIKQESWSHASSRPTPTPLGLGDTRQSNPSPVEPDKDWEAMIHRVASEAGRPEEIRRQLHYVANLLTDDSFVQELNALNAAVMESRKRNN